MTDDLPAASPAEAAIAASGLEVEAREMPALIRRVARLLPDATPLRIRDALVELRRKAWAAWMAAHASREGMSWVRLEDTRAAAALIAEPRPDEAALRAALEAALAERLRGLGATPEAALAAATADIAETTGTTLAPDRQARLALAVARAFGLSGAEGFAGEAAREAERRRAAEREQEREARARRREEVRRLREWERSLVEFRELPRLLGITQKEALRWAGDGRIPVARRIPGKGGERWEFDPVEVAKLRGAVAGWRGEQPAGPAVLKGANAKGMNAAVARVAALDRYAAHFRTARAIDRRITLVTGPTNSGKSYTALQALAGAQSGMALAPLRLLAHEFREALEARGTPASLTTGEERIIVPGARHVAATVEMCPFHLPVDVAVVDEAQMLHDRDRGAAWTAAIMGAPARHLYVLGAPDGAPMVRRIAQLCGDPLEEVVLQRKGPLVAARAPLKLSELERGDALIAFSRRDVLDFRAELVARGRRVAVVYGALSPEVRRAEAARFNAGDAEILIATDAIGMGLNLNIRRIVFSELRKFDGESRRELTSQEVKQIGGRAGRFGKHEAGVVAVLAGGGSPETVARLLAAPPEPPEDLRPLVQPDADIVAAVAQEIGSDSLFGVLARIKRAVLRKDDPNYRLADLTQHIAVATEVDGIPGLSLAERWTYALCPVDVRDNGVLRLKRWALEHGGGRPIAPPMAGRLPAPERAGQEDLEKAEKTHRRLVAWRWMAQRYPQAYSAAEEAEGETQRLNKWIEDVLRTQRRARHFEPGQRHRGPGPAALPATGVPPGPKRDFPKDRGRRPRPHPVQAERGTTG